jgi:hypothetical protein
MNYFRVAIVELGVHYYYQIISLLLLLYFERYIIGLLGTKNFGQKSIKLLKVHKEDSMKAKLNMIFVAIVYLTICN